MIAQYSDQTTLTLFATFSVPLDKVEQFTGVRSPLRQYRAEELESVLFDVFRGLEDS